MDVALGGFAGALGVFAFFGGIALLIWVGNKGESEKRKLKHDEDMQRRQMEHTERLKALEAGFPLPDADLAFARTERVRAAVAAAIGITVPAVMVGCAVGATALVLLFADSSLHLPVLCVIWGCAGLASFVTAVTSIASLSARKQPTEAVRSAGAKPFRDVPPPGLEERVTTLE
jgi:hypothetical protein